MNEKRPWIAPAAFVSESIVVGYMCALSYADTLVALLPGMVKDAHQTIITDPETNTDKAFTFDYRYILGPPCRCFFCCQMTIAYI
jgi:hypothetical protein